MDLTDPVSVQAVPAGADAHTLPTAPNPCEAAAALAACPVAVVGVDAQGRVRWANDAARGVLPGLCAGVPLAALGALDAGSADRLASALLVQADTELVIDLQDPLANGAGSATRARLQASAGGERLVWLTPVERRPEAEAEADAPVQRLSDLLRMACDMGRLGVWERDLLTGQGTWDERVFQTRGLEGAGPAPTFDDAANGIVAADRPAFETMMRQSLQTPPGAAPRPHWRSRYRIRGRDGVTRTLHKQWFVEHGPQGQPLRTVGLVMDDSDAFSLMRTRDESVSQLELAADLTGVAVWRYDLATNFAALSPQGFLMLGMAPQSDPIPIETMRSLFHPADRVRAEQSLQAALAGGPPADDELRLRRQDGEWRTLVVRRAVQRDPAGQPQAVVGVGIDVTERLGVARVAAELSRRFELAIGAAGIGHWTFDARRRTTRWSPPLRAMHGLAPGDAVPGLRRWLAHHVPPADRAPLRRRIAAWLRHERRAGVRLDLDVRIRRLDGQMRELLIQVVVEDESTHGGSLFGLVLDITEHRLAKAASRDRERALRDSEAKSRFMSRMNHELRTPLNAVLGFAQLLLDEDTDTGAAAAKRRQRIGHIRSAGRHLLELINDAIDLSSLEGGEAPLLRQPVALATLVLETLPLVEALCVERGVSLDVAGVAEGTALADPMRLRQVLLNLLSNAVKYNRRGGSVRIDAGLRDGMAVLRVVDTGRGMTPQQMRQLFEPFNRLGVESEDIEGSGIGLTIVKSLTERMGGTVRVESVAGVGSTFELRLPAANALPAPVPGADEELPVPPGVPAGAAPSRTVLYIEDDPINVMIMTELLARRRDVTVHVAADGVGGVEQARQLRPGLILLDMHLPDIDGLDVLARLRADPATAAVPVVGLSANAMRDDVERARAAGIDGYWAKPLDHAAFLEALDGLFALAPAAAPGVR